MRRPSPETADAAAEAGASEAAVEAAGADAAGVAEVAEVAGVAEVVDPEHAATMRAIAASRVGHVAILRYASDP